MAILNLTGQNIEKADIAPKLLKLKNLLDQRKVVWDKLDLKKKKQWIASEKDPIMDISWSIYKYLKNNFFGEQENA